MKLKVLIITYYWPPSGGSGVQRWVKFAKYLPEFGIEPVVLTVSNPTYASIDNSLKKDISKTEVYKSRTIEPFGIYSALSGKSKSEIAKPSTRIKETSSLPAKIANRIRANIFIPDARAGWIITAQKKALKLIKEHSIQTFITTGPPHSTHLIGRYLKNRMPLKWIADFRDPWTKIFYNESLNRSWLAARIDLNLEQSVLKMADEVIVTSPTMKELQNSIIERTYTYIPNGFDPEDFDTDKNITPVDDHKKEVFTIRHIGTLPESSVPYGFFQALARLKNTRTFRVELIGNVHPEVWQLINEYNLHDEVFIKSYVPHQEAINLMKSSDLLLLIIPDTSQNNNIIPGKLFEYIGSNRPVISVGAKDGDTASIIKNLQQGEAFDHTDISGIENFLEKTFQENQDLKKTIEDNNHPYSRFSLTKQLSELILDNHNIQPH